MNDLIDRQMTREEAIDVLKHNYPSTCFTDLCEAVDIAIQALSVQPERKKGKWVTVKGRFGDEVECDNCHSVFWYWMGNYRFCPNCGARMDGESE